MLKVGCNDTSQVQVVDEYTPGSKNTKNHSSKVVHHIPSNDYETIEVDAKSVIVTSAQKKSKKQRAKDLFKAQAIIIREKTSRKKKKLNITPTPDPFDTTKSFGGNDESSKVDVLDQMQKMNEVVGQASNLNFVQKMLLQQQNTLMMAIIAQENTVQQNAKPQMRFQPESQYENQDEVDEGDCVVEAEYILNAKSPQKIKERKNRASIDHIIEAKPELSVDDEDFEDMME